MSDERLIISPKYAAFLRCQAELEVLEGTTAAGKTTVGLYKFVLKCVASPKKLHILAADDVGSAEKNIIQKDLGILDDFGDLVEYYGNGTSRYKLPHLLVHSNRGDKVIFVVGYSDKARWKKALGGQYGCLYIDEINTANMDFVREAIMRADYTMATLNPDDPALPIYSEYINRCRPLPAWSKDTPDQILKELTEPKHEGWVHWFFGFGDNYGLTEEKRDQIIGTVPKGTKLWKNKVLGLRGRATGLVFSNFDEEKHTRSKAWLHERIQAKSDDPERIRFRQLSSGLDTAYSTSSADTLAMTFQGITDKGVLIILEEEVLNNADRQVPFAPSDIAERYRQFLDRCCQEWGVLRNTFIDAADQATITELAKYKRAHACPFIFNPSYKIPIIDRINLQLGWIETGKYIVLDHCKEHIRELNTYSYDDKGQPEDGNDHTINSNQYGWIPYIGMIGDNNRR